MSEERDELEELEELSSLVTDLEENVRQVGAGITIRASNGRANGQFSTLFQYPDEEVEWRKQALCLGADSELFFPQRGESMLAAYKICYGCPVREPCLVQAMEKYNFGVWGGFTYGERKKIKAAMRAGETLKQAMAPFDKQRANKLQRAKSKARSVPLSVD